ncbi:MAG TPA: polysaccharide pyruvyl transferase family protein, partial [Actinotalea sp.]|nr:polysaccharide pyruvyl transferase family protein [Actinotalea sp.]
DLVDALAGFDLVVSTRLHGAILALDAGTPVLPIAYEFKTQQVMDQLGLGGFVTDIRDATGPALTGAYRRLVSDLPERREPVADHLAELAGEAREVGRHVRAAAQSGSASRSPASTIR